MIKIIHHSIVLSVGYSAGGAVSETPIDSIDRLVEAGSEWLQIIIIKFHGIKSLFKKRVKYDFI